jgi:peptidoglycan/LPS O-acetylase OafA/YrhL
MTPFIKLGKISYSLYLIHMLPVPIVDAVLRRAGLEGHLYIVNVAAQTIASLVAGALFYHFVERRFIASKKPRSVEASLLQ